MSRAVPGLVASETSAGAREAPGPRLAALPAPRERDSRAASLAVLVLALAALVTVAFYGVVRRDGLTVAETLALVLFVPLSGSLAFNFLTTTAGFLRAMGRRLRPPRAAAAPTPAPADAGPRVALVMVVRHEDVGRVHAGLRAMYRSLAESGPLDPFTLFLLSDSTDPVVGLAEERLVRTLADEFQAPHRIRYRRRADNRGRKAGNLADFCARWGAAFEYMVVLDADSLLDGATIRELVRRMERQPRIGILQVPTRPVNRGSLFGRVQQFSASLHAPLVTDGLDFWLGDAAPYWGHNAIIRIAPFAKHCRLPRLPGREPLGGEILSHDVVEGALMRRAGWDVRLAPDLGGSYEELPANLVAYARRERRWCQGNLQHLRLVFAPGFALESRLAFAVGAFHYLCGPAWVLFVLALGVGARPPARLAAAGMMGEPSIDAGGFQRLPTVALVTATLLLLFLPRLLALARLAAVPGGLRLRGGAAAVAASAAAEGLFTLLVTPILLTFQAASVLAILAGAAVGWGAQARADSDTPLAQAVDAHGLQTLGGLAAAMLYYAIDPRVLWWSLPGIAGLWLSIPLSVWSSRVSWGARARRRGLFLIPEEVAPPRLLRTLGEPPPRDGTRERVARGDVPLPEEAAA